jgi:radical SAM protein with 4Fe4S-binding SPASM domain
MVIEFTTMVGCSNMCVYCPQSVFLKNYSSDVKILTLDNFKELLKNVEKDTKVIFSGFAESFLNPYFIDMLIHSHVVGHKLILFSTLQGLMDDDIVKLKENNVSFEYVNFHSHDGKNYNEDEFIRKTDLFMEHLSSNEYLFNFQKKIDSFSRASNNKYKDIEYKTGKLVCNFFGRDMVMENVVLPNGDVHLCCMDWGLKHKIGNLFTHHYNSNQFNLKRNEIYDLLLRENSDVLCRKCEFSVTM